jgi:hypothetical protein
MTETQLRKGRWFWLKTGSVLCIVVVAAFFALEGCGRKTEDDSKATPPVATATTTHQLPQRIQLFCSRCHENPPADTFPRSAWKTLIERMYEFANESGRPLQPPPIDDVVRYFEGLAPENLPPALIRYADHPLPVNFQRIDAPDCKRSSCISNVQLVHLFDPKKLDVLACDMNAGLVLLLQPYLAEPKWHVLYDCGKDETFHPAHVEVADLDGDHIPDILVANLGNFLPTDRRLGSVLWLRGRGDGSFEPITLLKGKGRIADVQAADFNGDGKLDLLVACFGWKTVGEIYYLENNTKDGQKPSFTVNLLDERHGAIHVPVADVNGDGKPDFVALISQEHETIVSFVNDGKGHFEKQTLYKAPHPGYGSSGIQLVDLNGDGKLDVLYTNGDVLDSPYLGFAPK